MSSIQLSGNASGAGVLTIAAPNTASNYTLTLPAETGTVITSGTTSGINATGLTTGTVPKARLPAGSVLQVVSTTKTDSFSSASTTFTDVTGLSVTITPTSATSNILILVTSNVSSSVTGNPAMFNLVRNSTNIAQPSTSPTFNGTVIPYVNLADNSIGVPINFLDSPATTSATTYKIQGRVTGGTFYVNRRSSADFALVSSITVMEIAA